MKDIFDVTRQSPTFEEIGREYKRQIYRSIFEAVACAALTIVCFQIGARFIPQSDGVSMVPFALAVVYSFVWLIKHDERFAVFGELTPDLCGFLLEYCEATPEGQAYRRAVIAEGRKFTMGDYWALRAWTYRRAESQKCRQLYGVPEIADAV